MKNVECRVESVGRIVVLSGCDAGWVADFDFEISRLLEIGRYAHRADEVVITFGIKRAEGL